MREEKKSLIIWHRNFEIIEKDLSVSGSAEAVYKEVKEKNIKIDILVNNAGFGDFGSFKDADLAKQLAMMRLNMETLVHLTHLFLPDIIKNKGKILNVASTAAFQPGPLMSVYFATKSFVLHFSEGIAEELQSTGVTVTALCPGATASEFQSTSSLEESKSFASGNIPTSREVALYGYKSLMEGKAVAVHGLKNRLFAFATRLFPRFFVRKMTKRILE